MNENKLVRAESATPEVQKKDSVVQAGAATLGELYTFINFRNRAMVLLLEPFPHFVPLTKERFDRMAYHGLGGVTRSRVNDVFSYVCNRASDYTEYEHLILFGVPAPLSGSQTASDDGPSTRVWNADTLTWVAAPDLSAPVWRSPYGVVEDNRPVPFVMSLAGNDQGLYDDIMQSLAPLVMTKKPDGVLWWVGDGANGKSTLMDAIYKILPEQLSSLTVKALTDGRDTPRLNGTLANIVKESSEGRIEDTEIYKAVGTHEDFTVHKFHSQDSVTIRGNMHHIFSANAIPTFNDKGYSARRRTFIVPFTQRFESDPSFEERTFNAEMFGHLIYEMTRYAVQLRDQGYRYKWSAQTLSAKMEYDADANNAEEYAREIITQGVVAFDSYSPMKIDYEGWCADNGYVPLGVTNLRRALTVCGFSRGTVRYGTTTSTRKMYKLETASPVDLQPFGMGRPGMYTMPGFIPKPREPEPVPPFQQPIENDDGPPPEPEKKTILKGNW